MIKQTVNLTTKETTVVELNEAEIAQASIDEAYFSNIKAKNAYKDAREKEYITKGWSTAFDLIDDILVRGVDAVSYDRTIIKNNNPKPV